MEIESCRKRVARAFDIKSSGGIDNEAIWTLPAIVQIWKSCGSHWLDVVKINRNCALSWERASNTAAMTQLAITKSTQLLEFHSFDAEYFL